MLKGVRETKKPTLKDWIEKHKVSSQITSSKYAVIRAIEHEQRKYEYNYC
jgi:hypothetical protein